MRVRLPQNGDATPWKLKFAWLPTIVSDHKIWWEHYLSRKEYIIRPRATKDGRVTCGLWEKQYKLYDANLPAPTNE